MSSVPGERMAVLISPGQTALARMPRCARSAASSRVRPVRAALGGLEALPGTGPRGGRGPRRLGGAVGPAGERVDAGAGDRGDFDDPPAALGQKRRAGAAEI